jgi:hypothetical protein
MKNILKNLDRRAGRWLDTMDAGLHEPIVRVLSGEVLRPVAPAPGGPGPTPPPEPATPPATPRAQPAINPGGVPGTILYSR